MKVMAYKCDGPECEKLSVASNTDQLPLIPLYDEILRNHSLHGLQEGWFRQEMEPYASTGFPPYCEMVAPDAKDGYEMMFICLVFCGKDCQKSWWEKHQRECGCHTRYMDLLIRLPIPYATGESPTYLSSGELLEYFCLNWPSGAEWVCGNCLGPAQSSYGEHECLDPVCHSETKPCYNSGVF